jgi:hypothetical protein
VGKTIKKEGEALYASTLEALNKQNANSAIDYRNASDEYLKKANRYTQEAENEKNVDVTAIYIKKALIHIVVAHMFFVKFLSASKENRTEKESEKFIGRAN